MHDDQQPRRVVPRWRSSKVSAVTSEAVSLKSTPSTNVGPSKEVDDKLAEFQRRPSIPVAAELMFLAAISGNKEAAFVGASSILDRRQEIGSSQLIKSAERVLGKDTSEEVSSASRDFVKRARDVLRINYHNPILLIDVARELAAMRQDKSALKYVRMAHSLAPNSRFVTRAAARFYLHVGEHEHAHRVLLESPLLGKDPWIQASEVAVATVRGRTSSIAKQKIRQLIEMKIIGHDLSELATALGTVEMLSGSDKKAKKLFKGALANPNDNSLAQAEWAATKLNLIVDSRLLETPFSFEANSHNAYRHHQIEMAIDFAEQWARDEPFASRPLGAKCYLLSLMGRYGEALDAAKSAYELDSGDLSPALNYLFTKILSGDLDGATSDLIRLGKHPDLKNHATQYLANAGALAYASQDIEFGRSLYQRAIRSAKAKNEAGSEALARAFFARIANEYGDPQAQQIIAESYELVSKLPSFGALFVMKGLVDSPTSKSIEKTVSKRNPKQDWVWDSLSNTLRLIDPS